MTDRARSLLAILASIWTCGAAAGLVTDPPAGVDDPRFSYRKANGTESSRGARNQRPAFASGGCITVAVAGRTGGAGVRLVWAPRRHPGKVVVVSMR